MKNYLKNKGHKIARLRNAWATIQPYRVPVVNPGGIGVTRENGTLLYEVSQSELATCPALTVSSKTAPGPVAYAFLADIEVHGSMGSGTI